MLIIAEDFGLFRRVTIGRQESLRDHEVAGSNPVAPTILQKKPFGENVEGLPHFGDQRYNSKLVFNSHNAMV